MNFVADPRILRQETGSFGHRFKVGPAVWPHFDLLWIHEGSVWLEIGGDAERVFLSAPDGVLLFPELPFHGGAVGILAGASICHFETDQYVDRAHAKTYLRPHARMAMHVQNLLRLSLHYAYNQEPMHVRSQLLQSVLNAFGSVRSTSVSMGRIQAAWDAATDRLDKVRSLVDVAGFVDLSESSFRALHRQSIGSSAGRHLRDLRLREAERLLATTGNTVAEVSKSVGYSSPESFSYAFKSRHGQSPAAFRKWARNFA